MKIQNPQSKIQNQEAFQLLRQKLARFPAETISKAIAEFCAAHGPKEFEHKAMIAWCEGFCTAVSVPKDITNTPEWKRLLEGEVTPECSQLVTKEDFDRWKEEDLRRLEQDRQREKEEAEKLRRKCERILAKYAITG